jgi:hypothetical protein
LNHISDSQKLVKQYFVLTPEKATETKESIICWKLRLGLFTDLTQEEKKLLYHLAKQAFGENFEDNDLKIDVEHVEDTVTNTQIEMKKVETESEALKLCKEFQCQITFRKQYYRTPEHVTVSLNAWTKIIGKDLIEAVNRLVEVYHTAPINHDKLDWWEEQVNFYK